LSLKREPSGLVQETRVVSSFQSFLREKSGATLMEYGLIAAGVGAVFLAAARLVSG
jgi:Flp pilus assembly pilin Flp